MEVAGIEVKDFAEVEKVTIYLNLNKQNIAKVEMVGIKIIEITADDLKKKNDAIAAEQGGGRAFRLNRVSDLGHKVADGGNYFGQKEMVSPRLAIQDLEAQGFTLADIRAEWKTTHGNGRLALEFQRDPEKTFEPTQAQKSFCDNLLGMVYNYMHPYLNAPSALDPTINMTFNFVKRLRSDRPMDAKLRIGPQHGKFFACEA